VNLCNTDIPYDAADPDGGGADDRVTSDSAEGPGADVPVDDLNPDAVRVDLSPTS
jgi:hypothetical protein